MKRRFLGVLLAVVMVLNLIPVTLFASSDVYNETGNYLENQAKQSAPTVGSTGGEWIIIGLARSGRSVPAGYYDNVVSYVESNINTSSQLHRSKSTENSRVILALTAAGYDVTDVAGYNLLEGLTSMTYLKKQGINGPIWALIAFDSYDYAIPAGDGTVTRDTLIQTILDARVADGGWNLDEAETVSDPDMTGMALQALAPYYNTNSNVKTAVDQALTCLSNAQNGDGGYSSSGDANSESVVQVIVALTALGINPDSDSRFVKDGNSVLDALYTYAVDGGGFEHIKGEGINQMATEQGYYALTAYERFKAGKTSLYDMTDVKMQAEITADKEAAAAVDQKIEAIGTVSLDSEAKIKEARSAYDALTTDQKGYVTKLSTLEAAETKLAELKEEANKPDEPTTEEPDEPTTEEPDEPTTEEPDEPTTEEPDEPTTEEPDEPTTEEPEQPEKPAIEFEDVAEGEWYYDAVYWAVEEGITTGTSATKFAPDRICTRAEAVTFLYRAAGEPKVNNVRNPFKDVDESAYYYNAVLWAVEKGITTGTSDTAFSPDRKCQRAEIVTFIWRMEGEPTVRNAKNPFTDVAKDAWYYDAVLWAVNQGITTGTSDTNFSPARECKRCEIVTFLYREFGK